MGLVKRLSHLKGVVILLNALIMGLETDIQSPIFEWAEQASLYSPHMTMGGI